MFCWNVLRNWRVYDRTNSLLWFLHFTHWYPWPALQRREDDFVVVFEGYQQVVQWPFEGLHEWAHVAEIAEPARCCLQLFQVNPSTLDGHLNVPRNVRGFCVWDHPDLIRFCKSLDPFSRAFVQNRFLPRRNSLIFIPNCMAHFYVVGTRQHFPPQIKCISFAVRKNKIW